MVKGTNNLDVRVNNRKNIVLMLYRNGMMTKQDIANTLELSLPTVSVILKELTEAGLVCRRSKGNTYTCSDDRWALEFYWNHRNDSVEELVHAVMTNEQMWGQDLTAIEGFEAATVENLKKIRTEGALAAYASCL